MTSNYVEPNTRQQHKNAKKHFFPVLCGK